MVIYIEYILVNNFVIDYLLITLLQITKNEKYGIKNVIFAICIALCVSFIFPYLYNLDIILVVFKTVSLGVVILPLKRYKNIKEFFVSYAIVFMYACLIGGVIFSLINMLNIRYTISGFFIKNFEFPSSVFIIIVAIILYIIISLIKYIFESKKIEENFYNISLTFFTKTFTLKAYLDSGNFSVLEDKGIIYISKKIYLDLVDINTIKNIKYKMVELNSVKSKERVKVFYLDSLIVKDKCYHDIPCAIANTIFKNFDCLLHSDYV